MGRRPECRPIERLEERSPRAGEFLKWTIVDQVAEVSDLGVQLGEGGEAMIPERREESGA